MLAIILGSCDLMTMFFTFGMPYATSYYIRSQPTAKSIVLSMANKTMIISGAFSLVLALLGRETFSSLFLGNKTIDDAMIALLILIIIVNSGNNIIGATLIAQGDAKGFVVSTNIGIIVNAACTIILVNVLPQKLHIVLLGQLMGIFVTTLIMKRYYRLFNRHETGLTTEVSSRDFYRYGIQAQIGSVSTLIFKRIDLYIISHFLNTSAVGLYSVGLGLRDLAMTASRALAGIAGGDMADPIKRANGGDSTVLRKGILFNIIASLIIILTSAVTFPYFIPLVYGNAFSGSVILSIIIMGSLLPFSEALLIGKAIQSKGKPLRLSIGNIISALICSFVVWQLSKRYNTVGAAIATIVDSVVLLLISWVFLRMRDKQKNIDSQNDKP